MSLLFLLCDVILRALLCLGVGGADRVELRQRDGGRGGENGQGRNRERDRIIEQYAKTSQNP